MEYYLILYDGKVLKRRYGVNRGGFTLEEAEAIICQEHLDNARLINMSKDLKKIGKAPSRLSEVDAVGTYMTWADQHLNKNINGFSLPISVKTNNMYRIDLERRLEQYQKAIDTIAFKYEDNLVDEVQFICRSVMSAIEAVLNNEINIAENIIISLISKYINNTFWVSELNNSYAFRGVAPFLNLQSKWEDNNIYKQMNSGDLTFYRARTKKKDSGEAIEEINHMLHPLCGRIVVTV